MAVEGSASDELLGVREGFVRYFSAGLRHPVPLVLVPHGTRIEYGGLPLSDEDTVRVLRERVARLAEEHGAIYDFYLSTAGGFHSVTVDGDRRHFVRSWSVIRSSFGEAWGASGSIEIPARLISDGTAGVQGAAVPGTRRQGGMTASLTLGVESRRSAVAEATLHALASLLYGVVAPRGDGGGR